MALVDRHVGARLRALREGLGLTSREVAKSLSCHEDQLDAIERGETRASPTLLARAAQLFNVASFHFFDGLETTDQGSGHEQEESDTASAGIVYLEEFRKGRRDPED
ncbi:MAG: helix-turn-helix domain-containing protein [Hyphomicrobiaceae bacterium]